jgi:hypothetical protein
MLNHRYWKIGASSNGKKDGRLNIPANINVNPPYIKEFCNLGESIIKNIAGKWAKLDKKLKTRWLNATTAKTKSAERAKLAQVKEDEAVKRFKQLYNGEIPSMYMGAAYRFYWIVIIIMFLSEFPINNVVFRLFGKAEVFNYIVAGGIGFVILFGGHLLGQYLHEYNVNKIKRASCFIIPIVVVAAIFLVGYLRASYLHRVEGMASDNTLMFAFGFFNFLFFVIAALYSYKIHNPHLMEVHKTAARNRRAKTELERMEKILDKAKTYREKKFNSLQNKANEIIDIVHQRINIYWTFNLRNREDNKEGNIPEPVDITIPAELSHLEWDNENMPDENNLNNRKNGKDKYENPVNVIQPNDN